MAHIEPECLPLYKGTIQFERMPYATFIGALNKRYADGYNKQIARGIIDAQKLFLPTDDEKSRTFVAAGLLAFDVFLRCDFQMSDAAAILDGTRGILMSGRVRNEIRDDPSSASKNLTEVSSLAINRRVETINAANYIDDAYCHYSAPKSLITAAIDGFGVGVYLLDCSAEKYVENAHAKIIQGFEELLTAESK